MILGAPERRSSQSRILWIITVLVAGLLGGLIGGGVVYSINRQVPTPSPHPMLEAAPIIPVDVDINTAITDAVANIGPAVVTVINHLPPRRTLFGLLPGQTASGSGVIISNDGYIVTNNHVVEGTERLEIILADGTVLPADLVGVDIYADLAVLNAEGEMPTVASWGNSDALKPGETVIAIGSPLGDFKNTVTVGVVSATERSIEIERNFQMEGLIQTDAAINQGNSGGPLVNLVGQVVGINTLIVRGNSLQGTIAEGLGFASPSNAARAIVAQIIDKGYFSRPHLGIRYVVITPPIAEQYSLPAKNGVYLTDVSPDSPAYLAELRQGDILISLNGQMIDSNNPFINLLFEYEPGDVVTFRVVRDKEELDIQVTLAERPFP